MTGTVPAPRWSVSSTALGGVVVVVVVVVADFASQP
jgi:hypothetical protein